MLTVKEEGSKDQDFLWDLDLHMLMLSWIMGGHWIVPKFDLKVTSARSSCIFSSNVGSGITTTCQSGKLQN